MEEVIKNSKFTAAIKRVQSQARLSYAEREQTREDLQVLPKFKIEIFSFYLQCYNTVNSFG